MVQKEIRNYSVDQMSDMNLVVPDVPDDSNFHVKYAFRRSTEKIGYGVSGEDYLKIRENGNRIAFSVCDGVSQSFYSALSAKLVGDELVDYLWDFPFSDSLTEPLLQEKIVAFLTSLRDEKTEHIHSQPLREGLPEYSVNIMEELRESGSETVFISGFIDLETDIAIFVWMGDCIFRVWSDDTVDTNNNFSLRNYWSSRKGPVGVPQILILKAHSIQQIVAYSDGLYPLDQMGNEWVCDFELEKLIQQQANSPESDDISYVEIKITEILSNNLVSETEKEMEKITSEDLDADSQLQIAIESGSGEHKKQIILSDSLFRIIELVALVLLIIDILCFLVWIIRKIT